MARRMQSAECIPSPSFLEKILAADLDANRIRYVREYRFHPVRRWRADFMLPDLGVLIEVDGGTRNGGRHVRGSGFEKDCEKTNAAILCGWRVLRYTGRMVRNGAAIKDILELKAAQEADS